MAENVHAQEASKAAAQKRRQEQRLLRYAPIMLYGSLLIQKHQEKADDIYDNNIDNDP